jgi:quercetin dioxygenase-like cupin family protein
VSFQDTLDQLAAIGFRLDMIMPADEPHIAELSNGDTKLRVEAPKPERTPGWNTGRAGMQYRDLIPERPGFIASHIRVPDGGPVPDYVHYHAIAFQMIYCYRGWVRLVYEDQGDPFVMHAGECVTQPPQIRHRVLECSPGLEVVEIATPASHATFVDHALALPNGVCDREWSGQRFVHLREGFADDAMTRATGGIASMRIRRDASAITRPVFGFVLRGSVQGLVATDAFYGTPVLTNPSPDLQWLEVAM